MCGLAGEFNFKGPCSRDALKRMLSAVRYRGPDSHGIYQDGAIGFAHARLAIIDLSAAGNQPMHDKKHGLVLVFNGVIYNYQALRKQLVGYGYQFFSHSDTEVILKAYAHWGKHCLEQIDGIFAFAIWDYQCHSLFLARDRFGIKPLYYTHNQNHFRFASSPQALIAAGEVDTAINPVALHHHLLLHAVVPAPLTLLKGIQKVPPGHMISVNASGECHTERYWKITPRSAGAVTEDDWLCTLESELVRATKTQYEVADVPTGVLLSGGLDSSLLVALISQFQHGSLNTYSIGFENEGDQQGSEFIYSDLIVQQYGTRHHRFQIPNQVLLDRLPEAVDYMAEPMVSQDCIGFYLLAELVSQDIKVVQTGQGADEVFAGYFWYALMNEAKGSPIERFSPFYFDRGHDEFLAAVEKDYHTDDVTTPLISHLLEENYCDEFINSVLSMDTTTLIVDDPVKRVDNMTMAWGLEARVPFLDRALVEYSLSIPVDLKLKGGGKYLLKQLARKYLPAEVVDRPKAYFPVPALHHIRGQFLEMAHDILNSTACIQRGVFNRDYTRRLLNCPGEYMTPIKGNKLWHYVLLELWMQRHVDPAS